MNKFVVLLFAVVELVKLVLRRMKQQEKEKAIERVRENPGDWFDGHFNSLPDSDVPKDADTASETNTAESDHPRRRRNSFE